METIIARTNQLALKNQNILFVIPSGESQKRSHSVSYRFKAPGDFRYLSGCSVANAFVIIFNDLAEVVVLKGSAHEIIWGEANTTADTELKCRFLDVEEFKEYLINLISKAKAAAIPVGRSALLDDLVLASVKYQRTSSYFFRSNRTTSFMDSTLLIGELRVIKSKSEIELMRTAALKSSTVHDLIAAQLNVGKTEIEIRDQIDSLFLQKGMAWSAYETIVGSSFRALQLHAVPSIKKVNQGELILVDAGGEHEGYCADITRTFAADQKMTIEQKEIYDIVLKVQKATIDFVRPGIAFEKIDEFAKDLLRKNLHMLFKVEDLDIAEFMYHKTSHWIGMDVHDPCPYYDANGNSIILKEGMTLTIEPGLYFREEFCKRFLAYTNIGIRIEDTVAVTEKDATVLSNARK